MKILNGLGFSDDISRNTQFVMKGVCGISDYCVLALMFESVSRPSWRLWPSVKDAGPAY